VLPDVASPAASAASAAGEAAASGAAGVDLPQATRTTRHSARRTAGSVPARAGGGKEHEGGYSRTQTSVDLPVV
jgi:hypothetical protein